MARNTAVYHLESYELACYALSLLCCEQVAVDKLLTVNELSDPTQTCLDWGCSVRDIVTIEAEALLKAESIACAQTDILKTILLACSP